MFSIIKIKYSNRFYLLYLLVFLFSFNSYTAFSQDYGLRFNGQHQPLDERTGLNLTPNEFVYFNDEFAITFEIKIDLMQKRLFGYILRVINDKNQNIDLIISNNPTANNTVKSLNIIIGTTKAVVPINNTKFNNKWIKLGLKFSLSQKTLLLSIQDAVVLKKNISFKSTDSFKVMFGANNYKQFASTDVPDMSIRDIKLYGNKKLKFHYPLNEINGDFAYDAFSENKAIVTHPNWILRRHQEWQKVIDNKVDGTQLITADTVNDVLYLLRNQDLLVYNIEKNEQIKIKYKNSPIYLTSDHRAVYNYQDKKIYCYLIDRNLVSKLNILTGVWEDEAVYNKVGHKQKYQHHNSIYSTVDNSIYTFGGYGQYNYNNEVRRIDLKQGFSEVLKTDSTLFHPRYLAGIGELNDTIYVLGGYGSDSGNQLLNPKSYFDLLGYSIKEKKFVKKFEIPHIIDEMIVGNNIWIDEKNRDFYALISDKTKSKGYLQILKGNIDNPKVELVGSKIPYAFLDVKSFATLYYFPKKKKFLAYTSFLTDSIQTQFKIYSIEYPPIVKKDTPAQSDITNVKYIFYYVAFLLIFVSGLVWYLYSKKHKARIDVKGNEVDIFPFNDSIPKVDEIDLEPISGDMDYQIIFFGGFQIIDDKQNDITSKFSPLLKELFLLIWLYSLKNNKGISPEKLIEILWYHKDTRSAQNNKSVNIAKLKVLLNEIGGCKLTSDTGYWKIKYDSNILKNDYFEIMQILRAKKGINKKHIKHLIKITKKGPFLLNLNYEWLDSFKSDISDRIVDTLLDFGENFTIEDEPDFMINLADSIFNFDPINEEAMFFKCKAQYIMGKHSLAESTFKKFVKEYEILYGQKYKHSFVEVLNMNTTKLD
jgi:DNA-binding SARP family transcriptional activator/cbb3-type cytochrome oxidase subunit 3